MTHGALAGRRRFLSSSGLLVAGRIFQYLGQVLPVLVLPAVLSHEDYVDYSLVVPLGVLAGSLACGWLTAALSRYAFAFFEPANRSLRSAVAGYFVVLGTLCLALHFLLRSKLGDLYALVPLLVFAGSLRTTILVTLNSAHRPQAFLMAGLLYLFPTLVFLLACAVGHARDLVHCLLLLVTLEAGVGLLIGLAWGRVPLLSSRFAWSDLREYLVFGAPYIPGAIALWVLSISDRYFLAAWTDDVETANYVLSYQLGGAIINYPMMLFLSVFEPRILLAEHEQGRGAAREFVRDGARRFARWVPLCFVAACAIVLAGKRLAYPEFELQAAVTGLVIGAHLVQAAGHFPRKALELDGQTRRIAVALGLAALANVVANFALIPRAGALGAAFATVLAYALYLNVLRWRPDPASS